MFNLFRGFTELLSTRYIWPFLFSWASLAWLHPCLLIRSTWSNEWLRMYNISYRWGSKTQEHGSFHKWRKETAKRNMIYMFWFSLNRMIDVYGRNKNWQRRKEESNKEANGYLAFWWWCYIRSLPMTDKHWTVVINVGPIKNHIINS